MAGALASAIFSCLQDAVMTHSGKSLNSRDSAVILKNMLFKSNACLRGQQLSQRSCCQGTLFHFFCSRRLALRVNSAINPFSGRGTVAGGLTNRSEKGVAFYDAARGFRAQVRLERGFVRFYWAGYSGRTA
jgi:hypothetical protein